MGWGLSSLNERIHFPEKTMPTIDINPGPKPKREDGKDDRRHHVTPPNKRKHPTLPVHDPKKK
ncbi:hypothetical protein CJO79_16795 (plasmid) [Ralstonia solanacearum]|nr:hypothetical protein CJO79_16795 [Ralstonia solanacearum]AXW20779.1 hypothetical protein CJO85_16840 [Ralstonia solanacearum]AXW77601.1 hypothetical protein CJO97_16790 [Ralstonia solanacearum]